VFEVNMICLYLISLCRVTIDQSGVNVQDVYIVFIFMCSTSKALSKHRFVKTTLQLTFLILNKVKT
jgi:hypothetical protein